MEFIDVKKDKMIVVEYNEKFQNLLSFTRRLAPDDDTKVDCYKCYLPYNYNLNFGYQANLELAMRKTR